MNGLNANNGLTINNSAHLRQSVNDIITTPIGSRIMRRDYGSYVFELIDQAHNQVGQLRLIAATADALVKWEPRLTIHSATVTANADGQAVLNIEGIDYNEQYQNLGVTL